MSWFIVGLFLGILIGITIRDSIDNKREQKTLEQLDEQLRNDLTRYKNLSTGLLEDVKYWRNRYHVLQDAKDNKTT